MLFKTIKRTFFQRQMFRPFATIYRLYRLVIFVFRTQCRGKKKGYCFYCLLVWPFLRHNVIMSHSDRKFPMVTFLKNILKRPFDVKNTYDNSFSLKIRGESGTVQRKGHNSFSSHVGLGCLRRVVLFFFI